MSRLLRSRTEASTALYFTPRRASGIKRDDDQGVEDDSRQDRRRRVQVHDVQGVELWVGRCEGYRDDGEVLRNVVSD